MDHRSFGRAVVTPIMSRRQHVTLGVVFFLLARELGRAVEAISRFVHHVRCVHGLSNGPKGSVRPQDLIQSVPQCGSLVVR